MRRDGHDRPKAVLRVWTTDARERLQHPSEGAYPIPSEVPHLTTKARPTCEALVCNLERACAECGHEHDKGCFDCLVGQGWDQMPEPAEAGPFIAADGTFQGALA